MPNQLTRQYKFLRKNMKSENGYQTWKLNKWVKVNGKLKMCKNGLHSSVEPYDAFSYVQGEILAVVECRGEHLKDENKYCWREQRVIKTYRWTKKDSVRLAVYSAKQCLKNYTKVYPNDNRVSNAIKAAERWLKAGSKKELSAAESAAWSAESAARSAAWSAAIKKTQLYFKRIVKEKENV
jgi:hypothetical protein